MPWRGIVVGSLRISIHISSWKVFIDVTNGSGGSHLPPSQTITNVLQIEGSPSYLEIEIVSEALGLANRTIEPYLPPRTKLTLTLQKLSTAPCHVFILIFLDVYLPSSSEKPSERTGLVSDNPIKRQVLKAYPSSVEFVEWPHFEDTVA